MCAYSRACSITYLPGSGIPGPATPYLPDCDLPYTSGTVLLSLAQVIAWACPPHHTDIAWACPFVTLLRSLIGLISSVYPGEYLFAGRMARWCDGPSIRAALWRSLIVWHLPHLTLALCGAIPIYPCPYIHAVPHIHAMPAMCPRILSSLPCSCVSTVSVPAVPTMPHSFVMPHSCRPRSMDSNGSGTLTLSVGRSCAAVHITDSGVQAKPPPRGCLAPDLCSPCPLHLPVWPSP